MTDDSRMPVDMRWHGEENTIPRQQNASLLPSLGIFRCSFIFVAKERSGILVELNFGLCKIVKSSMFSCTHIIHLIAITEKFTGDSLSNFYVHTKEIQIQNTSIRDAVKFCER